MEKVFVICNKDIEKERYENMEQQLKKANIDPKKVEYFCKTWSNDIDDNTKLNGLQFSNINKAERSLLINHIETLKKIKNNYKNGFFLILESDAYVFPWMKFDNDKLNKIINISSQLENWDIINIGGSCEDIFSEHGYPKTKPININDFTFFLENRIVCIEGLIWNYKSIVKFLDLFDDYIKKRGKIFYPIDVFIDNLAIEKKINIYWTKPALLKQGSGAVWKSWLR